MYLFPPKSEFDYLFAPRDPMDVFTNPWRDYGIKCADEAHKKFKKNLKEVFGEFE